MSSAWGAQAAPALSLDSFPGADAHVAYQLVSQSPTEVVYTLKAPRPAFVYNLVGAAGMPMSTSSSSRL